MSGLFYTLTLCKNLQVTKIFFTLSYFSSLVAISHSFATFGQGSGPILMDNVQCVGTEPKLINCTFDPDASEDFDFEDAGVTCYNESG